MNHYKTSVVSKIESDCLPEALFKGRTYQKPAETVTFSSGNPFIFTDHKTRSRFLRRFTEGRQIRPSGGFRKSILDKYDKPYIQSIICAIALITSCTFSAASSPYTICAGPLFEYNFYGQPGIRATLSDDRLLGGHPKLMVSYTTSRLSFWNGANALSVDDVLVNASWRFRPGKRIEPYAGIDIGFIHYDREYDKLFGSLDNNDPRFCLRGGVCGVVAGGLIRPSLDVGYTPLDFSTVFPLCVSLWIGYDITKGVQR